jgi:hypothetical protein
MIMLKPKQRHKTKITNIEFDPYRHPYQDPALRQARAELVIDILAALGVGCIAAALAILLGS